MAVVRRCRKACSSLIRSHCMRRPFARSITLRSSRARLSRCTSSKRATARSRVGASCPGRSGLSKNAMTPAARARAMSAADASGPTRTTGQAATDVVSAATTKGSPSGSCAATTVTSGLVSLDELEGADASAALGGRSAPGGDDGVAERGAEAGIVVENRHAPARRCCPESGVVRIHAAKVEHEARCVKSQMCNGRGVATEANRRWRKRGFRPRRLRAQSECR